MRIGVISEGHSDRAVIVNLITGITGIDENDVVPLRPLYSKDETDKAIINPLTYSSWSVVKEECEKRQLIDGFLSIEGNEFVVIHLDTAEAELYKADRPVRKSAEYCQELRHRVIELINTWLGGDLSNVILYAIAIEEIEAWILPIYEPRNTCNILNPKKKLVYLLGEKKAIANYDNFRGISIDFANTDKINQNKYLDYNCSLRMFYEEVFTKFEKLRL